MRYWSTSFRSEEHRELMTSVEVSPGLSAWAWGGAPNSRIELSRALSPPFLR